MGNPLRFKKDALKLLRHLFYKEKSVSKYMDRHIGIKFSHDSINKMLSDKISIYPFLTHF